MATSMAGAVRLGKCTNFGNCSIADARRTVEVPMGQDFVCVECGKALLLAGSEERKSNTGLIVGALALLLLLVGGGLLWKMMSGGRGGEPVAAQPAPAPRAAPPLAAAPATVLRIAGSNTLGSKLVPALAEAWLKQEGATGVSRAAGASANETSVRGTMPGGAVKAVEIKAHGTGTAFDALGGATDIGMASRRVKPDEVTKLASLGDLTAAASEHVIGLDGLAIVVNKANPVATLGKEQLGAIFSGRTTDWGQLGAAAKGKTGPIALYARDDKSGTFDSFQQLVLGSARLAGSAKRYEDSAELSDAVAADPNGIGFIGLPYVRNARAVGIAEKGAVTLLPNRFTVATEDYPLSRRLYLYTAASPANPDVTKFVEFAKSKAGQDIVAREGFVEQTVQAATGAAANLDGAPAEYKRLTATATRLSLNFRFRTGSTDLDNKAIPDLDRVVQFLSDMKTPGSAVMLFGFADARGASDLNLKLSRERAQTIAEQFRQRGIQPAVVTGFGAALPVASNDTAEGQEKNRRVEIWVKR